MTELTELLRPSATGAQSGGACSPDRLMALAHCRLIADVLLDLRMQSESHAIIGFVVRFIFGAVFGLIVGLLWFPGWPWILVGALLFGIAASLVGDAFWEIVSWWA